MADDRSRGEQVQAHTHVLHLPKVARLPTPHAALRCALAAWPGLQRLGCAVPCAVLDEALDVAGHGLARYPQADVVLLLTTVARMASTPSQVRGQEEPCRQQVTAHCAAW